MGQLCRDENNNAGSVVCKVWSATSDVAVFEILSVSYSKSAGNIIVLKIFNIVEDVVYFYLEPIPRF
jgi:hypothetical protein